MWRNSLDRMDLPPDALADGVEVVISGGLEYYPGSGQASPGLRFRAFHIKLAGEGELLAKLAEIRRRLHDEGLHLRQKTLSRTVLPRTIGVITGETGAARDDVVAALGRRGWAGRIVWAFAPVQDRHAAPRIVKHLTDLAALPEVDVIVVARGGGSLADLWAFCDESLCRTVALLGTPVISAVGHESDHTLIDDVSAESCSTPTHAAEAAVPLDCAAARRGVADSAGRLRRLARGGLRQRARHLVSLARVPGERARDERRRLHQKLREVRAATRRGVEKRRSDQRRIGPLVLGRKANAASRTLASHRIRIASELTELGRAGETTQVRRREAVDSFALALRAHDPQRTLERGYARVDDAEGRPVTSAAAAAAAARVGLRFADGRVEADVAGRVDAGEGVE